MSRTVLNATISMALFVAGFAGMLSRETPVWALDDPHAYFNALIARPDHYKSFSLRSAAQVNHPELGGRLNCSAGACPDPDITYSPATDADPNKQDAAKVRIPAFRAVLNGGSVLQRDLPSDPNHPDYHWMYFPSVHSGFIDRQWRIGTEIVTVPYYLPNTSSYAHDPANNRIYVLRGQFGTTAATHVTGSTALQSVNSVNAQLYLPIGTADGHSYVFTWDTYWTDSWKGSGLVNMKTFNLTSPGGPFPTQWIQQDTRLQDGSSYCTYSPNFTYGQDVGTVAIRAVNVITAPNGEWSQTDGYRIKNTYGAVSNNPLCPLNANFVVKPNRWTRYWVRVQQIANDYEAVDMWVADEQQSPVRVYANVPMSEKGSGIPEFWVEFNTSTNKFVRGNGRDLVAYVRNFVALRDVADTASLLVKPLAGAPLPPSKTLPKTPVNLRIVP
jgi:hypothetical protein